MCFIYIVVRRSAQFGKMLCNQKKQYLSYQTKQLVYLTMKWAQGIKNVGNLS